MFPHAVKSFAGLTLFVCTLNTYVPCFVANMNRTIPSIVFS